MGTSANHCRRVAARLTFTLLLMSSAFLVGRWSGDSQGTERGGPVAVTHAVLDLYRAEILVDHVVTSGKGSTGPGKLEFTVTIIPPDLTGQLIQILDERVRLDPDGVLQIVRQRLGAENEPKVRSALIHALGRMNHPSARRSLLDIVDRGSERDAESAAYSLLYPGTLTRVRPRMHCTSADGTRVTCDGWFSVLGNTAPAARSVDPEVMSVLAKRLTTSTADFLKYAILHVDGCDGHPEYQQALVALLPHLQGRLRGIVLHKFEKSSDAVLQKLSQDIPRDPRDGNDFRFIPR